MSFLIQSNEATAAHRRILLYIVSIADGRTPITGLVFTGSQIMISQNGAAEAAFTGTVTEIGSGLYYYQFTQAEVNFLGFASLRTNVSGSLTFVKEIQVVSFDPYAMQTQFADALLGRDITTVAQATAPKFSLLTAILKAVSKVANVAGSLKTYKTDGTTVQLTQAVTTNPADQPIDSIDVGT